MNKHHIYMIHFQFRSIVNNKSRFEINVNLTVTMTFTKCFYFKLETKYK